ncbi:MAG: hypothetical protein CFE45_37255, partial [Burkholderiales bacterium PBB5]
MSERSEPLGLTVHTLPQPGEALVRQRASGRLKMLLVMAVCAAPVLLSYFLYYVARPSGGATAYSTLVQPTVPMPAVQALTLDGQFGQPSAGFVEPALVRRVLDRFAQGRQARRTQVLRGRQEAVGQRAHLLGVAVAMGLDDAAHMAGRVGQEQVDQVAYQGGLGTSLHGTKVFQPGQIEGRWRQAGRVGGPGLQGHLGQHRGQRMRVDGLG